MNISPARVAAFEILSRIETDRAYSSVLLPIYEQRLASVDRALCHELVMGVLRRKIYLDRTIELHAGKRKLDTAVRVALWLGIYQLISLDKIPDYSAINESVNLVQRAKKTSAKGLVNAILRKVSQGQPRIEYADETDRIATETSHPRWLIEKWTGEFGRDEAERIARANNTAARPAFRLTRKASGTLYNDYELSGFVRGCYFATAIDETLRTAAEGGEIYFQDEGSQLVGQIVAERAAVSVFDVCAAPGGKTSQVAACAKGKSAFIVAGDLHPGRVRLLRSTCEKQGVDFVNVLQYDAVMALPFADKSFDTVLVDAPCSGTGTIRHNPEIRYLLDPGDFSDLSVKQLAILRNASKLVRPGGRLVYSTCSLQVEENEDVCKAFVAHAGAFELKMPNVPARFLTGERFLRTFPHRDSMDGFFLAEFERVGDGVRFR